MLALLLRSWVVTTFGFSALFVLIWFVGPMFGFAGSTPLGTGFSRIIFFMMILLLWGLNRLRIRFIAARANRQLSTDIVSDSGGDFDQQQVSEEVASLKDRLEEALDVLNAKKGSGLGLYDLPWYLIIGPPGSGKTTALVNSGLRFPLSERFGGDALRGVGGTRNCDWWFTDDAVLLDTAGRYTTQDSHQAVDSAAWEGFLKLLKKRRKRRPINGAIVAVSVSDLLTQDKVQRDKQVFAIRQRLKELGDHLSVRAPVYLVLTKCDLLSGFTDFFEDLGQKERQQVLGMTFPEESTTDKTHADFFRNEFDDLVARLNQRVLWRVHQERDVTRRTKIFSFPQQMHAIRDLLESFATDLFLPSRYEEPPMLRGVYFASGTQEGSPIDRIVGGFSKTFGFSEQSDLGYQGQGKSYFIHGLFKEVIFPESELVGANRRFELQRHVIQKLAYGGAAAATAVAAILWVTSFTRNEIQVLEFDEALTSLEEIASEQARQRASLDKLLFRLNATRALVDVYSKYEGNPPLLMRLGLYQGSRLTEAASELYKQELDSYLLPTITYLIENFLAAGTDDVDVLYEALKTYLMLGYSQHRNPESIEAWMLYEWQRLFSNKPKIQGQYQRHVDALASYPFSEPELNDSYISRSRTQLNRVPLSDLMYGRMKRDYDSLRLPLIDLFEMMKPLGNNAFVRRGRTDDSAAVSWLFTREGFETHFEPMLESIAEVAEGENWVLREDDLKLTEVEVDDLREEMRGLYFAQYTRSWDKALRGVDVVKFRNVGHAAEVLSWLSATNSPMISLLESMTYETSLTRDLELAAEGVSDTSFLGSASSRLGRLLGRDSVDSLSEKILGPERVVDEHFSKVHELVLRTDKNPPPIFNITELLGELHTEFDAIASGFSFEPSKQAERIATSEKVIRIQSLARKTPEPISRWLQQIVVGSRRAAFYEIRAAINEQWQSEVLPFCRRAIQGRYPFQNKSDREITLADFGRLFGHGGQIDEFYSNNLRKYVKASGRRWSWKTLGGVDPGFSDAGLRSMQAAHQLREVFFGNGGQTVGVKFTLKPVYLDANVRSFSLDLNGQFFRYRHGPARAMPARWPGEDGFERARLEFLDDSGASVARTVEGPWAWFRLIGDSKVKTKSTEIIRATFEERGREATWEIRANTVTHPFDSSLISSFSCIEEF